MSDKLITEPCPWCGSDRIDAGYSRGYAQGDRKRPEIAAGCWDCSATGPVVLVPENSMGYAESAAKWNTMASAEKVKADKLALLEEVAHLINPDFCDQEEFYIIKQRIEAE